jgi:pSer/pThr/pTyr-binding forkhead associated (FHA) protein
VFALEIQSGNQEAAMLIRRPRVLLGPDERSHVVLPASAKDEVEVIRSLGRSFSVVKKGSDGVQKIEYKGSCQVELPGISVRVIALDLDLLVLQDEPLDRAGIRLMRRAAALPVQQTYPALMVRQEGTQSLMLSIPPSYSVVAGRGKQCDVRLDAPDVSASHVRIAFDSGKFWAEDLGSTNGTFIGNQQISGRIPLNSGADLRLGRSTLIRLVTDGSSETSPIRSAAFKAELQSASPLPCIVAGTKSARPARITVTKGVAITIGRDPSCDMWIGAPHVSRRQCSILFGLDGRLTVTDSSSNGTGVNGEMLKNGETRTLPIGPVQFDLGGDVKVGFCATESNLKDFEDGRGVFGKRLQGAKGEGVNGFGNLQWFRDFFSGYAAAMQGHNTVLRGAVWAATGVLIAVVIIMGHLLFESYR